jgi:hypothetical protein
VAKRAIEQGDEPVVGRHLGHGVTDGQGAGGHHHPVAGPGRLFGRRLEVGPSLSDLPGKQQAPAEPHLQLGVQAVSRRAERDRGLPPGRRVFPGQQAVGGIGREPGGIGRGLVAHAWPTLDGMVGQVGRLSPARVPERGEGPGVQVSTPGRGQLLLDRVPDQRVHETVGSASPADRADQPGVHRRVQGRDRVRRAQPESGGQRRVLEITAQHRCHLERLPAGGRERCQSFPDHLRDAAQRGVRPEPVGEQLDAFRDEQRVPAGPGVQATGVDASQTHGVKPLRDAVLAEPG